MNKLNAIANRFLPTNMRTLYRAGFVDADMELTEKGVKELEAITLETNMDALVKSAQELLDKKEKSKKK